MKDIIFANIISGISFIIVLLIIRYFFKKQRNHKDFYSVVLTCTLFSLLACYSFIITLVDIFSYKLENFHTTEGICEIYYFEQTTRSSSSYDIWIEPQHLGLTANSDDFSYLEEGVFACKATYLNATNTLIAIELK